MIVGAYRMTSLVVIVPFMPSSRRAARAFIHLDTPTPAIVTDPSQGGSGGPAAHGGGLPRAARSRDDYLRA
jgi:hypothetical protein